MKFRHADIPAALALVREHLEEEGKRLFAAGAGGAARIGEVHREDV